VPLLVLDRDAAEEDAAVEVLAVAAALDLQEEVGILALGLQVAGTVLELEPALFADAELGLGALVVAGVLLPAGQVLPVEQRFRVQRLQLDVTQVQLAFLSGIRLELNRSEPILRCVKTS